jgi:ubiquitin-small subunit ribosomal protein S27Ae
MAKKQKKNKVPSKKYTKYSIEGDKVTSKHSCPKCGPGIFLGDHKDRLYCGKCHYVEFKSKKE